jgi:hypothetical protein
MLLLEAEWHSTYINLNLVHAGRCADNKDRERCRPRQIRGVYYINRRFSHPNYPSI